MWRVSRHGGTADGILVVRAVLTALSETISEPSEVNRTCGLVPLIKDIFLLQWRFIPENKPLITGLICLVFIETITTPQQSECVSAGVLDYGGEI